MAFSLWHEQWIPVTMKNGTIAKLNIRDVLVRAHEIEEVFDQSPLVTVAIHRLLLTILYIIFNTSTRDDWFALLKLGSFDCKQIESYGQKNSWKFDLLHSEKPFYQVQYMDDEKTHPPTALVIEAASGNNPTLFDHGAPADGIAMPLDRAACHLIAHQLFAIGGGVSRPFNRMDAPLTKGLYVEAKGETLFQTLLYNLIPIKVLSNLLPSSEMDRPFWEIDNPEEPDREGTIVRGPLHYYTWQSRQIHLIIDEPSKTVTGCQIRQRYCLPKNGQRIDPGKVYLESEKEGWVPYKIDKSRTVWQFTHVLVQTLDPDTARPLLSDWLSEISCESYKYTAVDIPETISLTAYGLATDPNKAAKIDLWRREHLPIPRTLLDNTDLAGELGELLTKARRVESVLERSSISIIWSLSKESSLENALAYLSNPKKTKADIPQETKQIAKSLGMINLYWPELELSFRTLLDDLSVPDVETARKNWGQSIYSAATKAYFTVRNSLMQSESNYEVFSRVEQKFLRSLYWSVKGKKSGEEG